MKDELKEVEEELEKLQDKLMGIDNLLEEIDFEPFLDKIEKQIVLDGKKLKKKERREMAIKEAKTRFPKLFDKFKSLKLAVEGIREEAKTIRINLAEAEEEVNQAINIIEDIKEEIQDATW